MLASYVYPIRLHVLLLSWSEDVVFSTPEYDLMYVSYCEVMLA